MLAQHQGGVAAAAIHRPEPCVNAQPRRKDTHAHDLVGGNGVGSRPSPCAAAADCGRKPIAVKANTQRIGMPTLASSELTATTSWSSSETGGPCALPCSLASATPRCARSSMTRAGTSSRCTKPASGGSAPRHAESIGKPGSTYPVRSIAVSPRVSASAPAHRSAGRTRPPTTRLASTSKPVATQATTRPPDRSRSRMTAASSSRIARSANVARSSRWVASSSQIPRSPAPVIATSAVETLVAQGKAAAVVAPRCARPPAESRR